MDKTGLLIAIIIASVFIFGAFHIGKAIDGAVERDKQYQYELSSCIVENKDIVSVEDYCNAKIRLRKIK